MVRKDKCCRPRQESRCRDSVHALPSHKLHGPCQPKRRYCRYRRRALATAEDTSFWPLPLTRRLKRHNGCQVLWNGSTNPSTVLFYTVFYRFFYFLVPVILFRKRYFSISFSCPSQMVWCGEFGHFLDDTKRRRIRHKKQRSFFKDYLLMRLDLPIIDRQTAKIRLYIFVRRPSNLLFSVKWRTTTVSGWWSTAWLASSSARWSIISDGNDSISDWVSATPSMGYSSNGFSSSVPPRLLPSVRFVSFLTVATGPRNGFIWKSFLTISSIFDML